MNFPIIVRLSTVIVVALSSNLKLAQAPGNVLLSKKESGLSKDSVVNVSQLYTIDKENLGEKVSKLSSALTARIETGIKVVLDMD